MKGTPQTIGRYVVRERLGQGGMGVLYLALDPAIDRLVAVKLLGVQGPELRERFVREAGLAGRLQHPNIVTVFDVGTHEGQPFIAMEYIPGETLGELIQRKAPLALRRRLEFIVEACQGLAFAHRHGIVHRDVKPANLMVSRDTGALKVLDFGIARGMDSSLTQAGMVMGTPNYMSPEQLEGRPLDHRSDVFALGLVLYEVLGYRQAFSGDTPQAVWRQIATAQPKSILELNPNLDESLATIIDRSIAKRVEDRYPDLDGLRADLLRVIHKLQSMQSGDTLVDVEPPAPRSVSAAGLRRPDLARLAERRASQIAGHIRKAGEALARHDLEQAQEAAEEAGLLDTSDPRVVVLLERIRRELDAREVSGLVADADTAIRAGSLTSAAGLISRALQVIPAHAEALALRATLQQAIETRERSQERTRAIGRALEQAESQFAAGALEAAQRATIEALGYDPAHEGALELKGRLQEAVRERIDEALTEARAEAAAQRYTAALRRLEIVRPRDERVDALETELREARAALRERTQREQAQKEQAEREQAQREQAQREQAEREQAQREQELREQAEREEAEREEAEREQALRAAREEVERQEAAREEAAREAALREESLREGTLPDPDAPPDADAGDVRPAASLPEPRVSDVVAGSAPVDRPATPSRSVPAASTSRAVRPPIHPRLTPAEPATPLPVEAIGSTGEQIGVSGGSQSASAPSGGPVSKTATLTPPGHRLPATGSLRHTGARTIAANIKPELRRAQAQEYLERARSLLDLGDFARSLSLVDAALALDPTRVDAHDLRRHIDQAWAANELGRPARSRGAGL